MVCTYVYGTVAHGDLLSAYALEPKSWLPQRVGRVVLDMDLSSCPERHVFKAYWLANVVRLPSLQGARIWIPRGNQMRDTVEECTFPLSYPPAMCRCSPLHHVGVRRTPFVHMMHPVGFQGSRNNTLARVSLLLARELQSC